jgi:hypothetical protein
MGPKQNRGKARATRAVPPSPPGEYIDIDNKLVPTDHPLPSLLPSELSDNLNASGSRTAYDIQQLFRVSSEDGYRYCKTCE